MRTEGGLYIRAIPWSLLVLAVACTGAEAPPPVRVAAAPIRTDQPRYVLRQGQFGVLTSFDPAARTGQPMGDELPLQQRVSAPFVIEAPV